MSTKKKPVSLDEANANSLAELIADSQTTDLLRVRIITKLLEDREGEDFFKTMLEDGLSYGECPHCNHKNHWGIPEDVLNQMGYVTHERDPNVPANTNKNTCPDYEQACKKKKIVV